MCCADLVWAAADCQLRFCMCSVGLRVEISGDISTQQTREACWMRLAEEVVRRAAPAVLTVDRRVGVLASSAQWQALLDELDIEALRARPMAYVGQWPRFAQMEALNLSLLAQGFQAQVFDDEAAAERWLRYGEHGRTLRPLDHFSTKARSNT